VRTIGSTGARSSTVTGDTVRASRVRIKPTRRASWSTKGTLQLAQNDVEGRDQFSYPAGKDRARRCLRDHRTCQMPFRHRSRIARICSSSGWRPIAPATGTGRCSVSPNQDARAGGATLWTPARIRLGDIALRSRAPDTPAIFCEGSNLNRLIEVGSDIFSDETADHALGLSPWRRSAATRWRRGRGRHHITFFAPRVCLGLDPFRGIEIVTLANLVKRGGVCRVKRSGYQKGLHLRRDCLSPKVNPALFPATIVALSTALACLPQLRDGEIEEQMKIFTEEVMLIIASRCGGRIGAAGAGAPIWSPERSAAGEAGSGRWLTGPSNVISDGAIKEPVLWRFVPGVPNKLWYWIST